MRVDFRLKSLAIAAFAVADIVILLLCTQTLSPNADFNI